MKKSLNVLFFATGLMLTQACGPKSKDSAAAESEDTESTAADVVSTEQAKENKRAERIRLREEKQNTLSAKQAAESESFKDEQGVVIYNHPEVNAEYAGGQEAMRKYLADNVKYPPTATEGWEGTVFVEFVVKNDGNVTGAKVVDETEGTDQAFRDEAIRVVKTMPTWVPGKHKGKPVFARYVVPITFEEMGS